MITHTPDDYIESIDLLISYKYHQKITIINNWKGRNIGNSSFVNFLDFRISQLISHELINSDIFSSLKMTNFPLCKILNRKL